MPRVTTDRGKHLPRRGGLLQPNRRVLVTTCGVTSVPLEQLCDPNTYSGGRNLWVTQELPRLLAMLPRRRPNDGLVLTRGSWSASRPAPGVLRLNGRMQFHNTTNGRFDMFVPEVTPRVTLLSKSGALDGVSARVRCIPRHEDDDPPARPDDYWAAYIVPVHGCTTMEVEVEISAGGGGDDAALAALDAAFLRIEYVVYGHHGRTMQGQHVVLPLRFPTHARAGASVGSADLAGTASDAGGDGEEEEKGGGGLFGRLVGGLKGREDGPAEEPAPREEATRLAWREVKPGLQVLCIPTHLLCHMDDPVSVVRRYVMKHAESGDMVTIGETPLAVMQGRTRHPSGVKPGLVATFVCKLFNRFSSIATACGMQCLVDISGALRVLLAAAAAVAARLVGKRGVFYHLAGEQARLIDDVSGALAPYDQFITLGPVNVRETVEAVRRKLGLPCAVVDVNDLTHLKGTFQVLGSSEGVDEDILRMALLRNPAGNADQQTPLVLIRHDPSRRAELLAAAAADERARKEKVKKGLKFVQK